jgi:hypothetical protein
MAISLEKAHSIAAQQVDGRFALLECQIHIGGSAAVGTTAVDGEILQPTPERR